MNAAVSLIDDENVDIRVGGVLGGKIGTLSKEDRAQKLSLTYVKSTQIFPLVILIINFLTHQNFYCRACIL